MPSILGMDFDLVMQILGGPAAVARFLRIRDPSVHGWRRDGIPPYRMEQLAPEIERVSGGKYSRRAICPDVWGDRWPELIDAEHPWPAKQEAA